MTNFTCHEGLFRSLRVPFGLKNAPATFYRAVATILARCKWQYALVYLDEVIVYSSNLIDHFPYLETVLALLKAAGVSLKLKSERFSIRPLII